MEHSQKAAAEAEAQGHGGLRLEGKGGVVELELLQSVPQIGIFRAVLSVNAAVDHGLGGTVARQCLAGSLLHPGDGIAHPGILHVLDGGGEPAHFSGGQLGGGLHAQGLEVAAVQDVILGPGGHHPDLHSLLQGALHDAEIDDDAHIGVVLAVEDQGLQGSLGISLGCRDVPNNILQHCGDVDALLGRDLRSVLGREGQDIFHLVLHPLGVGGRQINLVDHRQDLQVVLHSQVSVGQGLGLDALGGVHDEHRPLAGGQGTGHLIVEVHMARGVDKVQGIGAAVLRLVVQTDGPGLNGDAPLPLQVHVVQQLALHLPLLHRAAQLDEPVRQGGFSMVDMCNDAEIADFGLIGHKTENLLKKIHPGPHRRWGAPDGAL